MRKELIGALGSGLAVVAFCFLLLWHDPLLFWKDDYEVSILPVFADVARSWSEGHWPLLSPFSWVCSNLAGEFQYGTFSVFVNAAVVLIWKLPLGFAQQAAALSMTHLFVLAMGAFLLARGRALTTPLAVMVALVAALNGWIICWGATDWFGALGAFAWLPLAWWGMERALDRSRSVWRFLWPAPFVYLLVTGGFPYTVLMLGLLSGWLALGSLGNVAARRSLWPLVAGVLLGLGLAAPAWLALFDYVAGSARAAQVSANAHWQWLLPPGALPGFVWPPWTVRWSDFSDRRVPHAAVELACGTLPPLVIAAAIFLRRSFVRQKKWELTLIALLLVIAMLPSANVFRWSFRWLPFLHLALALTAAEALREFGVRKLAAWAASATVFVSLLLTYLWLPTDAAVPRYNFSSRLTNSAPLDTARLYLSIYPPPEIFCAMSNHPGPVGEITRPGSTSMWAGLRFINGYSPIRGAGVGRAFACATHGEIDPGMAEYLTGWEGGPGGLLATLGVDGIVIAREMPLTPQPASEWRLVHESAEGRVYHRRGAPLPRVRVLASSLPNDTLDEATINLIEDSRNRLVANVAVPRGKKPTRLIISRPFFEGYRATIGGRTVAVESWRGLAPAITVPPGTNGRLVLSYRPAWLIGGVAISIACGLLALCCGALALRRAIVTRRARPATR